MHNNRKSRQSGPRSSDVELAHRALTKSVEHSRRQYQSLKTSNDWVYKVAQARLNLEKLAREKNVIQVYRQAAIESVRQASATFEKQEWNWRKTLEYAEAKLRETKTGQDTREEDNLEEEFDSALALNCSRKINPVQPGNFLTPEQILARQQAADLRAAQKEIAELKEKQKGYIEKSTAELCGDYSTSDPMDE